MLVGAGASNLSPTNELEDAVRSWRGAAEATSRLRERGCDGCLAGIEVQQLFCSQSVAIPEHQLKELNMKIDSALQAYKVALESLGHCEYAMKAGFHLNPKAIEASLLVGCAKSALSCLFTLELPVVELISEVGWGGWGGAFYFCCTIRGVAPGCR